MIAWQYLFREMMSHKIRVILIILAIAWGTTAITTMLAIGEGLRVTFGRAMQGVGQGLLIVSGGKTSRIVQGTPLRQSIHLTQQDVDAIQQSIPGIQAISGEFTFSAPLTYQGKSSFAVQKAVEPAYATIRNIRISPPGRFINPLDMEENRRVVVVGDEIVKRLFPASTNPLGKTILLGQWPFQVIGVTSHKLQISSYDGPDAYKIWIPASTYSLLTRQRAYSDLIILPTDPAHTEALQRAIQTLIAVNHRANPEDDRIVDFEDLYQTQQKSTQLFLGMQIFLGIVGGLALGIAGVGIANVMLVSISHATRDIGIQMAIGATPQIIIVHYLTEALLMMLTGGLLG
ncbi:MAG TPA: ABC transporter permease, partial [Coxiellaceae bacterium]|nr:ABC transporter permease [Coxiellaceae bacterium]